MHLFSQVFVPRHFNFTFRVTKKKKKRISSSFLFYVDVRPLAHYIQQQHHPFYFASCDNKNLFCGC